MQDIESILKEIDISADILSEVLTRTAKNARINIKKLADSDYYGESLGRWSNFYNWSMRNGGVDIKTLKAAQLLDRLIEWMVAVAPGNEADSIKGEVVSQYLDSASDYGSGGGFNDRILRHFG